ncbi:MULTISPECIES: M14 family metallopeptidase [Bacillaceae]|uniref:M14 family metallopeptidase n=1 Tax=Bacillales TaxID=1385 RepID=UPI0018845D84|nr:MULTISPECIES: M14 family metallopeptidase [Bacillaceae]MBF0709267.1 LysM peptidoglycan-binding domain-containing protein [Pseudalkalibacillus hwajinpoensis]MDO6655121.1 M14 family metallopeptidase [Anaerobacillus sp. 1_MG-2023]
MKIRVKSGDSLWKYSRVFQIPLRLILDSNNLENPDQLIVGEQIQIPGFVTKSYTIKPGDTLWKIAGWYGTPLDGVLLLNDSNPFSLQPGEKVNIPIRVTWSLINPNQNYDYQTLVNDIRKILAVYPFIKRSIIGESVMEKPIPELVVGTGKKKVHMNGAFHANEWLTSTLIMKFVDDYSRELTNSQRLSGVYLPSLYETTSLSLVPMVNPDGVDLVINGLPEEEPYRSLADQINNGSEQFNRWKANIRGVDLNNQYPAKWEIEAERKPTKPSPRNYPGKAPLTEPEAIAIADLTRRKKFDRALAFHSQGEVIFWGFEGLEPPESEILVREFSRLSGYRAVRYVDSFAGYKDWFIQDFRRPGFTVEIGKGESPLPTSDFNTIYQDTLGIFLSSLYM